MALMEITDMPKQQSTTEQGRDEARQQRQSDAERRQDEVHQQANTRSNLDRAEALLLAALACILIIAIIPNVSLFSSLNKGMNASDSLVFTTTLLILAILTLLILLFRIFIRRKFIKNKINSANRQPILTVNVTNTSLNPTSHPAFIDIDSVYNPSILHIRILEEPLTAQNFATIISALTELHTKCWLIAKGRFADLIEYTQTRNFHFAEEAHLVITKMTHNSPADIKLNINADASVQGLAEALHLGIDAFKLAGHRDRAASLENDARVLEMRLSELDKQSELADKKQARHIGAQKAELEKQKALLEMEKQQLEIERQRLEVQERRLDIEKKRIDYALETASKMVNMLRPDADKETREMLLRTLLPNLLQLGNGQGLELALPARLNDKEEAAGTVEAETQNDKSSGH